MLHVFQILKILSWWVEQKPLPLILDMTCDEDEFFFLTVKSKDFALCESIFTLFIIRAQRGISFGKLCSCAGINKNRGEHPTLSNSHHYFWFILYCWRIYLSACSMWCCTAQEGQKSTDTARVSASTPTVHNSYYFGWKPAPNGVCVRVSVSVWVRVAALTKIITAGALKLTNLVFS